MAGQCQSAGIMVSRLMPDHGQGGVPWLYEWTSGCGRPALIKRSVRVEYLFVCAEPIAEKELSKIEKGLADVP